MHHDNSGVPISQWGDPDWGDLLPSDDVWVTADPWNAFLPLFRENDVVVVCSAGNDREPDQGSDGSNPRRNAKPGRQGETSLIVVGGIGQDGLIWDEGGNGPGSNKFTSIITAYAPAAKMDVATIPSHPSNPNGNAQYGTDWGTSLSSGIVAGLVATFLDRPDLAGRFHQGSVASDMKTFLWDVVAPYHTDLKPDAMLRVGTYNYVPCPEDGNNGLVKRVGGSIRVPPNPPITANVSSKILSKLPTLVNATITDCTLFASRVSALGYGLNKTSGAGPSRTAMKMWALWVGPMGRSRSLRSRHARNDAAQTADGASLELFARTFKYLFLSPDRLSVSP